MAFVAPEAGKVRTLAFDGAVAIYPAHCALHQPPRSNAAAYGKDRLLETFEWIIGLLLGAVVLAALARGSSVPYPPSSRSAARRWPSCPARRTTLDPELALALFVAPVLLDAAFDTSLRDLRATGCR